MALSKNILKEFAKITNKDTKKTPSESTVYGEIVKKDNDVYVKIDGSEQDSLTPVSTTADVIDGERVVVMIKNHAAVITGNLSSPAARTDDVKEVAADVLRVDHVLAHKVTTEELVATNAIIDNLKATIAEFKNLSTEDLESVNADIEKLKAKYADVEYLSADTMEAIHADIENLRVKIGTFEGLSAEDLEAVNAEIENLEAENAKFVYVSAEKLEATYAEIGTIKVKQGEFENIVADQAEFNKVIANDIESNHAYIEEIESLVVDAETGNFKFANIDFSNIGKAAMEYFYANSGLIKNVVVGDQTITGELIGVTIKGDLIEAGTLKADRLVIKGSDGKYYKLNTDFEAMPGVEPVEEDSIHGSTIIANSITASKIDVEDLVAFDATLGGFKITDEGIHSITKTTVKNDTRGAYLDNKGQFNFGDANSYLMGYIDENDEYKIVLKAHDIILRGTNVSIETAIVNSVNDALDAAKENGEFDGPQGEPGADGSSIWTTSTAPTTPNYTFTISNLNGGNGTPVKVGDIIKYSYYLYTITEVSDTTVLAGTRVSIKGTDGTRGSKWYTGTGITGTSTTATIFSNSGVSSAMVGDMYYNKSLARVYRCTTAGSASVAKWMYEGSIKGADGEDGKDGAPGMTNILRGTNSVEEFNSPGEWSKGHWNTEGPGESTIIDITDAPNPNIKQGFQIVGGDDYTKITQVDIPVTAGEKYTISCYVRGTGGFQVRMGDDKFSLKNLTLEDETAWVRCSYTSIADTNFGASDGTTNVYFINTGTGTIQICGLKFEHSEGVTEWTPSPLDFEDREPKYAICDTPAGTAAKVGIITKGSPNIKAGDTISVKFDYANTALNPTLNVNGMGDKPIITNGTPYAYWIDGQTVLFTYDGTNWQVSSAPVYANTVTVGNSAGRNVYIDDDSVDIRYGSGDDATILATFTEGTIYLGRNSDSAIIDLCNGTGVIKKYAEAVDTEWQRLVIKADHSIGLESTGNITMNTYKETEDGYKTTGIFSLQSYTPWIDPGVANAHFRLGVTREYSDERFTSTIVADSTAMELTTSCTIGDATYYSSMSMDCLTMDNETWSSINMYTDELYINTNKFVYISSRLNVDGEIMIDSPTTNTGLSFYDDSSGGVTALHMDASGNIGVGYGLKTNGANLWLYGNYIHLVPTTGVTLANSVHLYAKNASGALRSVVHLNSSNQTGYGYGSYSAKEGSVYYDGDTIYMRCNTGKSINLKAGNYGVQFLDQTSGGYAYKTLFIPTADLSSTLGGSSYRFHRVYAGSSSIITSDKRQKRNIRGLNKRMKSIVDKNTNETNETNETEVYSALFDKFEPMEYVLDHEEKRISFGLIAQDVLASMKELGIEEDELDLVHHDVSPDPITGEEKETFGMAYENLIAMCIHEIQKLKTEIKTLRKSKGDKQ